MKKTLLLLLPLLPIVSVAQNFHFSTRLGVAGYQGDLKAKSVSLSQSSFFGSLGVRYDLTEHIALRSYLSLTTLKGDDKKGTPSMQTRNLNFRTSLAEFEGGIHYSFFDLNEKWWTP